MDKLKMQKSNSFEFFENVAHIIEQSRKFVGRNTNFAMCVTYFEIGHMIVEEEQDGKARAAYGKKLLANLSVYLSNRVGRGYSETTLKNARIFYKVYTPSIRQAMLDESDTEKSQAMIAKLLDGSYGKSQAMIAELYPFKLSWSHYLVLMRIKNDDERRFYEVEAEKQNWDYRWLRKQYTGSLYERLALSANKEKVSRLASEGQIVEEPHDMLKNPPVLDFLNLEGKSEYDENDLEMAIISKLQFFLLELGKGFLFEARQKRFTFNEKHYNWTWCATTAC